MPQPAPTRVSLLLRMRDSSDEDAWSQFTEIYGPFLFSFARRSGMQESDAGDLVQEVMTIVSQSIDRFDYNPQMGKFRSWLYKIAKRTAGHLHKRKLRQPQGTGDSGTHEALRQVAQPGIGSKEEWDQEYERQLLHWAADKVRNHFQDSTWQAFWLTSVEGLAPSLVAEQVGISLGSVYVAKNRVTKRLAEKIREIDDHQ